MDNFEDEFGFDENSELGKLFNLLNKAKNNSFNKDGMMSLDTNEKDGVEDKLKEITGNETPDRVEKFTEDGLDFTIKIWDLPEGEFKTIDIESKEGDLNPEDLEERVAEILSNREEPLEVKSNYPLGTDTTPLPKRGESLEKALEKAVAEEDFNLAIELRDAIKERDQRMKPIIAKLNAAIAAEDLDACDDYIAELKRIKNEYL
jgi:molecular chaperone DnaK (HSP70)